MSPVRITGGLMVIIIGKIKLASVEECSRLHGILKERASKSRGDAGNMGYTFSQNIEDPSEICLTETWESEDALNAHLQIPDPAFFEALETARIERARVVSYNGEG